MAELDKEISRNQKELEQHGRGDAGQAMVLCNLALSLHNQYKQTGEIMDLNEVISLCQSVLDCPPLGHSDQYYLLISLALVYVPAALDLCPMGNSDHAIALSNLAGDLRLRYQKLGRDGDLQEAILLL
ncbi:hypothetical protein J3A83DRAFT_4410404 [Scleroderma citrinum]